GKYLLKAPDEAGPGGWRGKAVEAGVDCLLFGRDTKIATEAMQRQWDNDAQGVIDDDAQEEYDALTGFLTQAMLAFASKPVPFERQAKVELQLPGIAVPLIGYADWVWPDHGTDLKTTWRVPTTPDPAHIEQAACYAMAHGVPFDLTYVSPKKWTRYEVTQQM